MLGGLVGVMNFNTARLAQRVRSHDLCFVPCELSESVCGTTGTHAYVCTCVVTHVVRAKCRVHVCKQLHDMFMMPAAINQRDSEWHKHTICTFGATILKIRSSSPPPTTPKLSAYFAVRQNQSDTSEKSLLKCGFWRLRHLNARTRSSER